MNKLSICFSGHRGNRLPGGWEVNSKYNLILKERIKSVIFSSIHNETYDTIEFYSGGALATDTIAFIAVEEIKKDHPDLNIINILCLPFKGFGDNWQSSSITTLEKHISVASEVIYVDMLDHYASTSINQAYQKRNMYMSDNADIAIVIYDGYSKGGNLVASVV